MQNRRKPRHSGHSGRPRHGGGNRPRKNYPQLREKYLNQARDALSSGDRVTAEYYFQHADHCFRMMMEEDNQKQRNHNTGDRNQNATGKNGNNDEDADNNNDDNDDDRSSGRSALPSFITMAGDKSSSDKTPPVQDWEERDAQ